MPKSLKRARPTAAAAVAQELARRVAIILVISQLRPGASRISQESFIHPSTTRSPAAPEPSGVARRQWSSAAIDGSEARVFDLLFVDDGMFDPRRDYWSHSRRNEADLESTPASLNRESGLSRICFLYVWVELMKMWCVIPGNTCASQENQQQLSRYMCEAST